VILIARSLPAPDRSIDVTGGFQGLGGIFPDAPSIRCFPQVIQSGFVCLLRQPVVHHVVDCRADHLAKSRPALKQSRRIKGFGVSPGSRVPARCRKCFKFDIREAGGLEGPPGRRRSAQGLPKIFSGFSRIRAVTGRTNIPGDAGSAKNTECFKRETSMAPIRISQT